MGLRLRSKSHVLLAQTTALISTNYAHFFLAAAFAGAGLALLPEARVFLAIARTAKDLLFLLTMTLKRSKSLKFARLA